MKNFKTVADTPEEEFEAFWKDLIIRPDGKIDLEQIKKELYDFSQLLVFVSKVYDHITGGKISKPLTLPDEVCGAADEHYADPVYELADTDGPIQISGEAAYEQRVSNEKD